MKRVSSRTPESETILLSGTISKGGFTVSCLFLYCGLLATSRSLGGVSGASLGAMEHNALEGDQVGRPQEDGFFLEYSKSSLSGGFAAACRSSVSGTHSGATLPLKGQ